jgi:hypothetical protein
MIWRNQREGGGLGRFWPTSLSCFKTITLDNPASRELQKFENNSSMDFLWCSMLLNSVSTDQ